MMSPLILQNLDQTELFQAALKANAAADSVAAIAWLTEAVSRSDATARAHYLLGTLCAQIKMYQNAIAEMESALAIDPALSIARLQVELMWLISAKAEHARAALSPLVDLPADDPLRHFGIGLCRLIDNRRDEAVQHLELGTTLNAQNTPLNDDVRRILSALARPAGPALPPQADENPREPTPSQHILLSAYTGNARH